MRSGAKLSMTAVAAVAISTAACAGATGRAGATTPGRNVVEPGRSYAVTVTNRTPCTASVRLQRTVNERAQLLGMVPAYGSDTFTVTPAVRSSVAAYALREDGRTCNGGLSQEVDVEVRPAD